MKRGDSVAKVLINYFNRDSEELVSKCLDKWYFSEGS